MNEELFLIKIRQELTAFSGDIDQSIASLQSILNLHARALVCHCECLGMNAENAAAVCADRTPPYQDAAYYSVMEKWRLIDDKGNPTI